MGVVSPLKPGMGRGAGNVGDFVTASLADYVSTEGQQPAGAVIVWMSEDGDPAFCWYQISRHALAYIGACLANEATE